MSEEEFNEILEDQQYQLGELLRICSNYGKDGNDRKNERNLKNKILELSTIWTTITSNNDKLEKINPDTHEYFDDNLFANAFESYEKVMNNIEQRRIDIKNKQSAKQS